MSEHDMDIVERMHREAAQRHWQEEESSRVLLEQIHRSEIERLAQERQKADELIDHMHRAAAEDARKRPAPVEEATLHYTELPEAGPDNPLCQEWEFYRRQVGRLLAEGHGGRHVLIKGEQVLGLWDTHDEAMQAGYHRLPGQPFLVHQVQERERILRCVSVWLWRNLRFR